MYNKADLIDIRKQELKGIRHEVKNYLTGVKGAAEIIRMQQREVVDNPMWEILDRSIVNLIDFLDSSKEIDDLWDVVRQKAHLYEVVNDIRANKDIRDGDVKVLCEDREICIDRASLRKAFNIIIENMGTRCSRVRVQVDVNDNLVIKFVGDTCFDSSDFLSGNKTFYAKSGGSVGLSLSCAKAIILLHEGSFEVANEGNTSVVKVII